MSQTKFLVTGDWRLGCGLTGLTDTPEWLRRTAASAVRKSVQNVLDIALASDCRFILVSGRIAPADNFAVSVAWLRERWGILQRRDIRLVVTGHDADELLQLAPLGVLALPSSSALWVRDSADGLAFSAEHSVGAIRLELAATAFSRSGGLCCSVQGVNGDQRVLSAAGGQVSVKTSVVNISALWPQRLSADEPSSGCGCMLVTADSSAGELRSEYHPTEAIEFQSLREHCEPGTTLPELLSRLSAASRGLSSGCSVRLVEWLIDGQLRVSLWDDGALRERDLLQALRGRLNAGHAGVWPYRLRFADSFRVELCAGSSRLLAGISGRLPLGLGPESEVPELLHQLQRVA